MWDKWGGKRGSSVETNIFKVELAFTHNKKYQAPAVKAKLKRRQQIWVTITSRGT